MSQPTTVRTQAEFDTAVAAGADSIRVDSPRGVWIDVATPREVDVRAGDPRLSESYYSGEGRCRYLELAVPTEGLVLLDDKAKFRACMVVREVTISGAPLVAAGGAR